MKTNKKTLFLTQFSILLALEAIMCFTPLGSIPIGPMVATLATIPVIVTAILLGTKAGAAMGFFTGLFSFLVWTFIPPSPIAFVFTPVQSLGNVHGNFGSLIICFVPRILIGVVAGLSFQSFSRIFSESKKGHILAYSLSGILGSLTTTILVLGGIYVFFGKSHVTLGTMTGNLLSLIGITILINGAAEAVINGAVAYAVCYPIQKHMKKLLS